MDKKCSGDAKILSDTEHGLRYFLFHKHNSTRVLGHFFIDGQGFCQVLGLDRSCLASLLPKLDAVVEAGFCLVFHVVL